MQNPTSHKVNQTHLEKALELGYNPKGWVPKVDSRATKFYLGDNHYLSIFQAAPVYYINKWGKQRPLSEVAVQTGNRHIVLKPDALRLMHPAWLKKLMERQAQMGGSLLFDSIAVQPHHMVFATDFRPDANPETDTCDGYLGFSSDSNWDTAHDKTTGNIAFSDSPTGESRTEKRFNGQWYFLKIAFYFNTGASIGASDTISAASLSTVCHSSISSFTTKTNSFHAIVQVQGDSVSSDTSIATSDVDLIGDALDNPTEAHDSGERIDQTSGASTPGTTYTHDFNATGLAMIAKSGEQNPSGGTAGITYLGMRSGEDITDTAPSTSNTTRNLYSAKTAEDSTEANRPVLAVTHAAGGGAADNSLAWCNF